MFFSEPFELIADTCYFTPKYFSIHLLKTRPFLYNQDTVMNIRKLYVGAILT